MAAHTMQISRFTKKQLALYGAPPRTFNPNTDPLITVLDLHKRFKNLEVLKGVELYVKKGDVVCIIEAMKCMNEIQAEEDGEIVEVLVKDGELVEYGQPLFKIN